ncbi:hypothetical protein QQS21_012181 [Conoideocrella luteorostrata]|uniref:RCC1-like domain-containing protein n=1 Tax=Conoideocrella luteorostrata TaxID=1105319 RepID=A0AAJ0CC03_9HYPO|nr:hypothetical protein QQS21_012181 [Conoideocrella luteorostrata]
MPPGTVSSTRKKIKHREPGPERTTDKASPRIEKSAQNRSTNRANHVRRGGGPKTSSRPIKRPLETENDDQSPSVASGVVGKRVKTSAAAQQQQHESPSQSRSAVINQVPNEKLTVLIFGTGENGELGLGPKKKEALRPSPNPLLDVSDASALHVVQIACGGMHTVALTADNKIITWGVNDEKALGRDTEWEGKLQEINAGSGREDDDNGGDDDDDEADLNPLESTPKEIPIDSFPPNTRFSQVAAGDSCSFALTDTGHVYGWGSVRDSRGESRFRYDDDGELVAKQARPFHIQSLKNITQICCGDNHALALDTGGNVWAWGSNEQHQFGRRLVGRSSDPLTPRLVRVCRKKAKYIASGGYHCFAIDEHDDVYGWGANSFGEAGDAQTAGGNAAFVPPTKIADLCQKQVVVLDGGAHHSAAVTASGQCLTWGRMDDGQLGIAFTPEQLQEPTMIRLDERQKPRICVRPTVIPTVEQAIHVACGSDHTVLIDQTGRAYSTGYGYQGQLGQGSNDDVQVMQLIGGRHVKNQHLTWAGAGGQFSMVTGPAS